MVISLTARLGLTRWSASTDPLRRSQLDSDNAALEAVVAMYGQGLFNARPAAGKAGRFYFATDTTTLYYDTGSAWSLSLPDYVTLGTAQTITGAKTFSVLPTLAGSAAMNLGSAQTVTGAKDFTGALTKSGVAVVVDNDSRLATMTQAEAENNASTAAGTTTGQRIYQAIAKWAVLLTGNQTVAGVKTFSSTPTINGQAVVATNDSRLATMTQAEAESSSSTVAGVTTGQRIYQAIAKWAMTLAGTQTVTGTKTFTGPVNLAGEVTTTSVALIPGPGFTDSVVEGIATKTAGIITITYKFYCAAAVASPGLIFTIPAGYRPPQDWAILNYVGTSDVNGRTEARYISAAFGFLQLGNSVNAGSYVSGSVSYPASL